MNATRCASPPEAETARSQSPSAAIDAELSGSIMKKTQRSSPDQPCNQIGPVEVPLIAFEYSCKEYTRRDEPVRRSVTQIDSPTFFPVPVLRTAADHRL